ncbi:hypothetical protein MTO96_015454 [Rhipicephalus appendiculatus]
MEEVVAAGSIRFVETVHSARDVNNPGGGGAFCTNKDPNSSTRHKQRLRQLPCLPAVKPRTSTELRTMLLVSSVKDQ